jgi:hypothetical protein
MRHRRTSVGAVADPTPSAHFGRQRVTIVLLAIITGAVFGMLLTVAGGVNFRTRIQRVESLGIFYRLALPDDILDLNDVRLAQMAVPGASDFARMAINNYWISSTENPQRLIEESGLTEDKIKEVKQVIAEFGTLRNHDNVLRGATALLRKGRNFFVFEMENRFAGYCAGGFRLVFNGQDLRGVPFDAPSGSKEIRTVAGNPTKTKNGAPAFEDVLCTRRVIEVDLGLRPEPVRRLRELITP